MTASGSSPEGWSIHGRVAAAHLHNILSAGPEFTEPLLPAHMFVGHMGNRRGRARATTSLWKRLQGDSQANNAAFRVCRNSPPERKTRGTQVGPVGPSHVFPSTRVHVFTAFPRSQPRSNTCCCHERVKTPARLFCWLEISHRHVSRTAALNPTRIRTRIHQNLTSAGRQTNKRTHRYQQGLQPSPGRHVQNTASVEAWSRRSSLPGL